MGLFKNNKNPNEVAYVGGKKHWTDVIKNSGDGEYLIWRQPEEDFNTNSTLIVMPGEAAIFIDQGKIVQVFENGTYKLSTENYPFITRLRTAFSGGISAFNCVVYFVRKAVSKELLWGTVQRIQVRDKLWGIRTDVGGRGAYKLSVDNPGVFLERLVGSNISYQRQDDIFSYFGEELQSKIVSTLSKFLNEWPGELIGLEAHLQELSSSLKPAIDEMLKDYGLKCESFSLSGLVVDTSKYDSLDESQMSLIAAQRQAQAEKAAKLLNAEADAGVFSLLGENWAKLQAAGILQTLAANPGAGGVAATGAGFGMGMAAGSVFSGLANQMFSAYPGTQKQPSANVPCYDPTSSDRYMQADAYEPGVSADTSPSQSQNGGDNDIAALEKLKVMLDKGLIPKTIYDQKVAEILSRM